MLYKELSFQRLSNSGLHKPLLLCHSFFVATKYQVLQEYCRYACSLALQTESMQYSVDLSEQPILAFNSIPPTVSYSSKTVDFVIMHVFSKNCSRFSPWIIKFQTYLHLWPEPVSKLRSRTV